MTKKWEEGLHPALREFVEIFAQMLAEDFMKHVREEMAKQGTQPAQPATPVKQVYTTKEAAAFLGVSTQTVELWRVKGGGPAYAKMGRMIRYKRESLDEWLTKRTRKHTSEKN